MVCAVWPYGIFSAGDNSGEKRIQNGLTNDRKLTIVISNCKRL